MGKKQGHGKEGEDEYVAPDMKAVEAELAHAQSLLQEEQVDVSTEIPDDEALLLLQELDQLTTSPKQVKVDSIPKQVKVDGVPKQVKVDGGVKEPPKKGSTKAPSYAPPKVDTLGIFGVLRQEYEDRKGGGGKIAKGVKVELIEKGKEWCEVYIASTQTVTWIPTLFIQFDHPSSGKEDNTKKLNELIVNLEQQIRRYHQYAMELKDSTVRDEQVRAVQFQRKYKSMLEDMRKLTEARERPGAPLPLFHYEEVEICKKEILCPHLSPESLEVYIEKAQQVPVLKSGNAPSVYVTVELPYPPNSKITKYTSPTASKSLDPSWNYSCIIPIERKKSFLRFCERRKVLIHLWHKGGLLRVDVCLGRVEVPLQCILTRSQTQFTALPILKEKGRRPLGGTLSLSIRVLTPLQGKHLELVKEKELVIDNHYPMVNTVTDTVEVPTEQAKEEVPTAQAKEEVPTAQAKEEDAFDVRVCSEEVLVMHSEDLNEVISNNVLEHYYNQSKVKMTKLIAKKQDIPDELAERIQLVEMKLSILQMQVESGVLTFEAYIENIQAKIVEDKIAAKRLAGFGHRELAKEVLQRAKIMEAELVEE